jgi:hypothetical protein
MFSLFSVFSAEDERSQRNKALLEEISPTSWATEVQATQAFATL